MTKEEKKERRQLRHKLYEDILNHPLLLRRSKFRLTTPQLRASARILADRILAGHNVRYGYA